MKNLSKRLLALSMALALMTPALGIAEEAQSPIPDEVVAAEVSDTFEAAPDNEVVVEAAADEDVPAVDEAQMVVVEEPVVAESQEVAVDDGASVVAEPASNTAGQAAVVEELSAFDLYAPDDAEVAQAEEAVPVPAEPTVAEPAATEPAEPAATEPASTEPAKPAAAESAEPTAAESAEPAVTEQQQEAEPQPTAEVKPIIVVEESEEQVVSVKKKAAQVTKNSASTTGYFPKSGSVYVQTTTYRALNACAVLTGSGTITYKSSNPSVLSINSLTGKFTPKKAGTVTITATRGKKKATCRLTVKNYGKPEYVMINSCDFVDWGKSVKSTVQNGSIYNQTNYPLDAGHTYPIPYSTGKNVLRVTYTLSYQDSNGYWYQYGSLKDTKPFTSGTKGHSGTFYMSLPKSMPSGKYLLRVYAKNLNSNTSGTYITARAWISVRGRFNVDAAVQYARDWGGSKRNKNKYSVYSHDCANFVSQCLYEGGLAMDSVWSKDSYAWRITSNSGSQKGLLQALEAKGYKGKARPSRISDMRPGDIIWCAGKDSYGRSVYQGHVMIITKVDQSRGIFYYTAHTNDRKDAPSSSTGWLQYWIPMHK